MSKMFSTINCRKQTAAVETILSSVSFATSAEAGGYKGTKISEPYTSQAKANFSAMYRSECKQMGSLYPTFLSGAGVKQELTKLFLNENAFENYNIGLMQCHGIAKTRGRCSNIIIGPVKPEFVERKNGNTYENQDAAKCATEMQEQSKNALLKLLLPQVQKNNTVCSMRAKDLVKQVEFDSSNETLMAGKTTALVPLSQKGSALIAQVSQSERQLSLQQPPEENDLTMKESFLLETSAQGRMDNNETSYIKRLLKNLAHHVVSSLSGQVESESEMEESEEPASVTALLEAPLRLEPSEKEQTDNCNRSNGDTALNNLATRGKGQPSGYSIQQHNLKKLLYT